MRNRRETGTQYEKMAAAYLQKQGYEIIEQNFRCRQGEIDIIAQDGEYLVFCEVKYRSTEQKGHPLEAVTVQKQHRLSRAALYYVAKRGLFDVPCRFDVIGILDKEIVLYKNAFDFIG